jgi:hypothetical protein
MRKHTLVGSAVALAVVCGPVAAASPALADQPRSGPESATGLLVVTGESGTREVVHSVIHMHGVFDGVGRIVEVPPLPNDPENVDRDNLVFPQGTIHLTSTRGAAAVDLNPQTCVFTVTGTGQSEIVGGTGLFAQASGHFDATVDANGVAARAADGSCDENTPPLLEVDRLHLSGHMSL